MRKDKYLVALIVFGALVITSFVFLQAPASSGDKMAANVIVEQLREQINSLWQRVGELRLKIQNINERPKAEENVLNPLDAKPPVLNNLEPEHITSDSAVITWGTDELSTSEVIYADEYVQKYVENKKKMMTVDLELVTFHEVLISGLKPNTKYYYYVSSTDANANYSLSNTHTIVTLPQERAGH